MGFSVWGVLGFGLRVVQGLGLCRFTLGSVQSSGRYFAHLGLGIV